MPQIKWRQQDIDLLRKEIRNFNRKVDRLMKSGSPEVKAALPPKMTMKTAKQSISSRSDFNKQIKSIKRFTERGSEQVMKTKGGVVAPKFEVKELEARVRSINAERNKRLKKLVEKQGPVESGDLPKMGRLKEAGLRKKTAPGKIKPRDWEEYKRSVMKQSDPSYRKQKDALYRQNYQKAIDQTFSDEEAEFYKAALNEIPDEDFIDVTLDDERLYVGFVSHEPQQLEIRQQLVRDAIEQHFGIRSPFEE